MKRIFTLVAVSAVAAYVVYRQLTMEFGPVDIKDVIRDSQTK